MNWHRCFVGGASRAGLALAFVLTLGSRPAHAQGVHVAVIPANQTVSPGATFDVELDVTQAGSVFDAIEIHLGYDPAALTFVQQSGPAQMGCLFTFGCGTTCPLTFGQFSAQGDSLKIVVSLLCAGVTVTGPGQLYKLRFTASNVPQTTYLTLRSVSCFRSGLPVIPAIPADGTVFIGGPTAVKREPWGALKAHYR